MSEFVNTLDILGDDALMDAILNRTITEFSDNTITNIGSYAFANCNKLTKVDLPKVTDITGSYIFLYCSGLKSVNIPNAVDTISVRTFSYCSSLTEISMKNVTKVDASAFEVCSSLVSVDLPKITEIGGQAFYGCSSLIVLDFPLLTGIRYGAFNQCKSLDTFILRANTVCVLDNINAFNGTPIANGLGFIYVPKALVEEYKVATNWSTFIDQIRAIEDYPEITGG